MKMMNSHHLIANRFELQDLLGRGGKGDVYCATYTQTGETVAVKGRNHGRIGRHYPLSSLSMAEVCETS
jgi:serine/threonine protein kinase